VTLSEQFGLWLLAAGELTGVDCFADWLSFSLLDRITFNVRLLSSAKFPIWQVARPTVAFSGVERQPGVQIFFAIPFPDHRLPRSAGAGKLSQVSLRGFCLMRFARIAPLLILLLAIHQHIFILQTAVRFRGYGKNGRALSALFLAATHFDVNLLEANRGYLPGNWDILWSLSVEEMFYFSFLAQ